MDHNRVREPIIGVLKILIQQQFNNKVGSPCHSGKIFQLLFKGMRATLIVKYCVFLNSHSYFANINIPWR